MFEYDMVYDRDVERREDGDEASDDSLEKIPVALDIIHPLC